MSAETITVDAQLVLRRCIRRIEPMIRPGMRIPRVHSNEHNASVVATALLRRGCVQARAVSILVETECPEVAVPNLRSLYEAFGELHYMLESESDLRAVTAFIFAVQQVKDFLDHWPSDKDDLSHVETELAQHAQSAPEGFALAKQQRNYWTKGSRAELIDRALSSLPRSPGGSPPEDLGRQLYKLLSWDDHHVMAALLTVDLLPNSATYGSIKPDHPGGDRALLSFLAFIALEAMRRWYVNAFPESDTPLRLNP